MTKGMTKQEAIEAMHKGKKVKHRSFSPGEWVTVEDGYYTYSDGYQCLSSEFWKWCFGEVWEDGYSIVE